VTAQTVDVLAAKGPPGMLIAAIGDVHGRLDLLEKMHAGLADRIATRAVADWRIIHLGDYVDRGPDARGVIDFLAAAQARDPRVICLAGNHDVGFLDFLKEPDPVGLFATNGGIQTALSYGVALDLNDPEALAAQHRDLVQSVPDAHRRFVGNLVYSAEFGDFFFCHAGIMPGVPLDEQEPRDLIWIRDPFLGHDELYAKVVVHGHTPARDPEVRKNRINVDTAAYATGVLTALLVNGSDKQFMQVVAG
jgi:serine/threonine protein phosphatase 1